MPTCRQPPGRHSLKSGSFKILLVREQVQDRRRPPAALSARGRGNRYHRQAEPSPLVCADDLGESLMFSEFSPGPPTTFPLEDVTPHADPERIT